MSQDSLVETEYREHTDTRTHGEMSFPYCVRVFAVFDFGAPEEPAHPAAGAAAGAGAASGNTSAGRKPRYTL